MKSALSSLSVLSVVSLVAALVWACSSEESAPSSSGVFANTDAGSTAGVECTHPGAGRSIGGDRCECPEGRAVGGDWTAKRTCRDNTNAACTKDQDETFKVTLSGTNVTLSAGGTSYTGTICGDFVAFNGSKAGGTECGQLRLADDTHWFLDTCFVSSGECLRSFGQGCPSQKIQCTGTATKGGPATAIAKDICK